MDAKSGGTLLLWKSTALEIQLLGATDQEIHVNVKIPLSQFSWVLTTIYASVDIAERLILWQNLKNVADNMNLPWMVMRDFNDITNQLEKKKRKKSI